MGRIREEIFAGNEAKLAGVGGGGVPGYVGKNGDPSGVTGGVVENGYLGFGGDGTGGDGDSAGGTESSGKNGW